MSVEILECFHQNSEIEFLWNSLDVRVAHGLHKPEIISVAVALARRLQAASFAILPAAPPAGVETQVTIDTHRNVVQRSGIRAAKFQDRNVLFLHAGNFLPEPFKPLDVVERIQLS
jgi:hypothetical protein